MTTAPPRLAALGGTHPAVMRRRLRDALGVGLTALVPLVLAVAVTTQVPNPSVKTTVAVALGGLVILALVTSPRLDVTVAILALYLGLLDGPVKLASGGGSAASAARDILIFAVSAGALVRLAVRRERIRMPPLSGWVLAWTAIVVAEAFNPQTTNFLKVIGGFRQQLEWVPFFFFGYVLMRSRRRFRQMFVLLGIVALANGLVGTYQTRVTPSQLASWGPGYSQYVYGGYGLSEGAKGLTGRTFSSEGVQRVRPPALGSNEGFGGSVGTVSLAGILALLAAGRLRRRWLAPLLLAGAVVAVATSLQRTQVVGSVGVLIAFALLSFSADRRVFRTIATVMTVVATAVALVALLIAVNGGGAFSRYTSISPSKVGTTAQTYREKTILQIPTDIKSAPFGVGLGTEGAAAGFGEKNHVEVEGQNASAESQYNLVVLELGLPGLLLWISLAIRLITLAFARLRTVADPELRLSLIAVFATVLAYVGIGFAGPTMASPPYGPFFWFVVGIAAYWLAGPDRERLEKTRALAA